MNAHGRSVVATATAVVVPTLRAGGGVKLVSYRGPSGELSSMLAVGTGGESSVSVGHAVWCAFRHECGDRVSGALSRECGDAAGAILERWERLPVGVRFGVSGVPSHLR